MGTNDGNRREGQDKQKTTLDWAGQRKINAMNDQVKKVKAFRKKKEKELEAQVREFSKIREKKEEELSKQVQKYKQKIENKQDVFDEQGNEGQNIIKAIALILLIIFLIFITLLLWFMNIIDEGIALGAVVYGIIIFYKQINQSKSENIVQTTEGQKSHSDSKRYLVLILVLYTVLRSLAFLFSKRFISFAKEKLLEIVPDMKGLNDWEMAFCVGVMLLFLCAIIGFFAVLLLSKWIRAMVSRACSQNTEKNKGKTVCSPKTENTELPEKEETSNGPHNLRGGLIGIYVVLPIIFIAVFHLITIIDCNALPHYLKTFQKYLNNWQALVDFILFMFFGGGIILSNKGDIVLFKEKWRYLLVGELIFLITYYMNDISFHSVVLILLFLCLLLLDAMSIYMQADREDRYVTFISLIVAVFSVALTTFSMYVPAERGNSIYATSTNASEVQQCNK